MLSKVFTPGVRMTAVVALIAVACVGCGYSLIVPGSAIPEGIGSVYVERVADDQLDPEFADALTREMRRVLRRDGRFRVADSAANADAILRMDLVSLLTRPVAFDRFDEVLDYETTIKAAAVLETSGGMLLWKGHDIGATRSHAADASAVVTTSSGFQSSERLLLGDLEAYDSVQLGEAREQQARHSIASDLAAVIYSRMLEAR